jgi:precorrin-4 methylase
MHDDVEFEDIPLKDARTMGRGPHMDPCLYAALHSKIQSLATTAARMTLPDGVNATTMKNRILRVAAAVKVPVTVRRVSGGVIFWRSSDEDRHQAHEVAQRLRGTGHQRSRARGGRRRRAGTRSR